MHMIVHVIVLVMRQRKTIKMGYDNSLTGEGEKYKSLA